MGFSISGGMRAWRFADLDPEIIASQFGWKLKEARANLAAIRKKQADPAWVDATLAKLSVPSLAVLATLVDFGGYCHDGMLLEDAARTHGISKETIARGVTPLLDALLVVVTTTGRESALSLVEPAAAHLAARLRDVDVPPLPAGAAFVRSERLDDGRALVAACAALAHVDIKLTQAGMPNRASTKRVAKAVGLDEDVLERLLVLGLDLQILAPTNDEIIRPVARRLREVARGDLARVPILATFVERLRAAGGRVQTALADRWITGAGRVSIGTMPRGELLGSIPGLARGTVGSVEVVCTEQLAGVAAVSVTPSFEVYVPPEARCEHVVDVMACAELVRIDRVIVARISKSSIQRAVAAGATAESILASLGATARTPVPQNVAAAIQDWAGGQFAVTAVGRVIVVPLSDEARAVAQLAPHGARAIAPGVIVVDGRAPARAVTTLLAKLGITVRAAEHADDDEDADKNGVEDRDTKRGTLEHLAPLSVSSDDTIRQRFVAFRAGQSEELAKVPAARSSSLARPPMEEDDDFDDLGERELRVSEHALGLVETWERARNCVLSDGVATIAAALIDAIAQVDQQYLLAAKNVAELEKRLQKVVVERGGLDAFMAKNADVVRKVLGADGMTGPTQASQHQRGRDSSTSAPVNLDWVSTDLLARLSAASRTQSTLVLDLGNRVATVRIRRVLERGNIIMVLGEDVADESAIAVPIQTIVRIAEPPASPSARAGAAGTLDTPGSPKAWKPLDGQTPPAGHMPCPCGSGVRYRSCCRQTT